MIGRASSGVVCALGLALVTLASLATGAAAQTSAEKSKTALAGATIELDHFFHTERDCSNRGYVNVRVATQPAGRVAIKREKAYPGFNEGSIAYGCNGRKVDAVGLYYTAAKRFSGRDIVDVEIFWNDGDLWTRRYTIDVR